LVVLVAELATLLDADEAWVDPDYVGGGATTPPVVIRYEAETASIVQGTIRLTMPASAVRGSS